MRRAFLLSLATIPLVTPVIAATEPLPIIVTYEMRKARKALRSETRDPRGFWVHQVVARIEDQVSVSTLRLKEPVTVELGFVVAHDGRLVSKAIVKSSGVDVADTAAATMLERAQPFPPMPSPMNEEQLSFSLPIRFR